MKNRKLQFVDNLFDIIPTNTENETAKKILVDFLLANTNNGKLYKYREVNEYALDNLRHNTLFCAKPSTFNDPFDCKIGVDFSSYIEYKFSPKINKMMDLFEKYMMLKSRRSTNESCSVEEKIIFDTWEKSKKLTGFLELIQSKNVTEKEITNILVDNPEIIMDILFSVKGTDISDNDIDLAVESTDFLLKKMNKESLIPVFSENASYMDWAKSFGIDEEADEITLTKYMFQKNFPEKISVAEQFDTDMDMVNKNLSDMMDEKFKIGCLCTDYKNKLMWSHYGNGHKGFCIEYDFGIDCNELNDTLILPVLYTNERPKIPWDVIFAPNKDDPQVKKQAAKHMIKSLLTKDSAWEYEDEWRVIMLGDNIYPNKKMPPITCIYIGALCEENDKKELLKIAQSNNIPVKQMVVDRGEYTVHAKTLDYLKEGM